MALLLEANLPFAKTLERVGPDDAAAQRCCLGMQPKSPRQRLACWRPVREFLLHAHGDVFPRSADAFLDYLAHLRKGGAAKTSCKSAQLSLAFLEEAGEVDSAPRLSDLPSVANFVKEAKLAAEVEEARARETSAWRPLSTDQAPQLLLRLVEGFEAVVADAERPLYRRAFAWYLLLRHWASLRWDDTQGIQPSSFDRRARGLYAALEKSKTSGPGKRTKVLPVYVSQDAFLRTAWLDLGLGLWEQKELAFDRDYLLPLPTPDLKGTRRTRALYSDSAGFSRALLASLTHGDGEALLLPEACSFWSEHSDRAGLDSWAASLRVEEPERSFLGRWGTKGSANVYVRTACRVCENIQRLVTQPARESHDAGPDYFGEEGVLRDLAAYLRAKGVDEATVAWQVRRLTVSNFAADPSPQPSLREEVRNLRGPDPLGEQDSETELANTSDDDNDEDDTPALLSPEGPPSTLASRAWATSLLRQSLCRTSLPGRSR